MTVNEFRRTTLGLRDVVEGCHMGHPDFRVNNRIFASLNAEQTVGTVKLPPEEQRRFVDRDATVFVPAAGAWGQQGWTKVHLAAADGELVGEALTLAWQVMSAQAAAKPRRAAATARRASPRTTSATSARAADLATPVRKPAAGAARSTAAASAATSGRQPASRGRSTSRAAASTTSAPRSSKTTATSASASAAAATVIDDYIAHCEPAVRTIMNTVRGIVRAEAPAAREKFSYRMPAFEMDGMLLYYAPFKQHLGIFPPVKGDAALDKALKPYRGEKGNLRFPFDRPMPYTLIRRVVRARLKEHQAHLASRRSRKSGVSAASRSRR